MAFAVRYVNLRDWQGGLLLRCPAEAELSRVAICAARCSVVVFDCAFSLARPVFRACYGLRLEPAAVETARCGGTNARRGVARGLRRRKRRAEASPAVCGGRNRTLWRYQPHWPPPSAGETARFGEVMGMRMPQQQHPHAHKSAAALPGQPSAGETAPDGRGTSHTAGETTPPARHLRRPRGRYDAHAADRDACATVATVRVRSRPASDRCCPEPAHVQVPDATASAHPQVSVPTSRRRRRPCRGRTSCSRCTASC